MQASGYMCKNLYKIYQFVKYSKVFLSFVSCNIAELHNTNKVILFFLFNK